MRTSLFLAFSLFTFTPSAFAGDDHKHEAAVEAAPHGGMLRDADPFKAELVIAGDDLKIYLYDKALKPKTLAVSEMKGEYQLPKGPKKSIVFKKKGEFYTASIKGVSKVHRYDLHVTVVEAGKPVLIDFGIDNI